jgi:hypothetical protein
MQVKVIDDEGRERYQALLLGWGVENGRTMAVVVTTHRDSPWLVDYTNIQVILDLSV